MTRLSIISPVISLLVKPTLANLVGYGIWPYNPPCAFACDRSLSSLKLNCSIESVSTNDMGMEMGSNPTWSTSPACYADDTNWLTTLAWCLHSKCARYDVPNSELEAFWEAQCTGDPAVTPEWGYSTSLAQISQVPTQELGAMDTVLNHTVIVNAATYSSQYNVLTAIQRENVVESGFGIAILVAGFATTIALTWLGYLPYASGLINRVKPYLVYQTLVGTYHVRPLPWMIGNAPTIGQSIYIAMLFLLNLILTSINYQIKMPNAWFPTSTKEIQALIFYRTGVFAFVLAPLVLLFSSRNNILLWITNWSHSTYVLLHRWVARIFALQVLLHSLTALPLYYSSSSKEVWWIWGAVATLAVMILTVASGLYFRRLSYEAFLISHMILSIFVLVGSWYHVVGWIGLTWGYETWLYAACAVWLFDRLARRRAWKACLRLLPTLNTLRPWENHPFSIIPTFMLQHTPCVPSSHTASLVEAASGRTDVEKRDDFTTQVSQCSSKSGISSTAGVTLFIRRASGMTKHLRAEDNLLTLLDGPYPNNSTKGILRCDRVILIGGGIGITSLLPWTTAHPNVKLAWSLKRESECLFDALDGVLSRIADKVVMIGSRLDIRELLADETEAGWQRVGVVVSGPGTLCDDARAAVVAAGKKGNTLFELEVDAYSW